MEQKSTTLKNPTDGFEFYVQVWHDANTKPDKVLVIQHGFGEHSGRYTHLLEALEGKNTIVYALDSRGHGKTPGKRGHISDFSLYASDLAELVKKARKENPGLPMVLLGHSMGGLVATEAALKSEVAKELKGLIVSSGAFFPALDTLKAIKKAVGTVLAKIAPAVTVAAGLDVKLISRDANTVEAYKHDPLVHGMISMKMGVDLFATGPKLIEAASGITLPTLVIHGDADGIAQVHGSKDFFAALSSQDKTLKIYPGFYHETMNEPLADRKQVLNEVVGWFVEHAK